MKPALVCSSALVALSLLFLLSLPASAASASPTTPLSPSAGVARSGPELQAAGPKKRAPTKKPGKAKKTRAAAGKK